MDDLHQDSHAILAWNRNTLPCALSILNHRISAEVCLLGHQWISRGFTLRKVQYRQYTRSQKIHWTLITQEMREDLQIDFFPRNALWMFLWDPTEKRQYPKSPPPKKKNLFLFGLGKPIRDMLSIFRDDRSTTLSSRIGLFQSPVVFNGDMPSSNKQQIMSCKNRYF